jgi:hypothetical protein
LHLVLDGTQKYIVFESVTYLKGSCELDELLEEFRIDGLMDVDTLEGDTDLGLLAKYDQNSVCDADLS